jgi:four helix bundle protein
MKSGSREVEKAGTDKIFSPDFVASHRELKVFQKAYALALEVHKASLNFPKTEQYALADQLRRSTKSVCANIAEGFARQRDSKLEWKRFLMIALGSCEESSMWLDFCRDLRYVAQERTSSWQNDCNIIIKMIHKLRNT